MAGFEPAAPAPPVQCATWLRHIPMRAPGEDRTPDPRIRNPVLCPLSYKGVCRVSPPAWPASRVSSGGLEPPASELSAPRSDLLSYDDVAESEGFEPPARVAPCCGLAVRCLQPDSASSPCAPRTGIEPAASRSTGGRSPIELTGQEQGCPSGHAAPEECGGIPTVSPRPGVAARVRRSPSAWTRPESNRPPPLCESGALPDELRARGVVLRTRSAIRTRTGAVLSGVPLPLGYPGVEPAAGGEPAACR